MSIDHSRHQNLQFPSSENKGRSINCLSENKICQDQVDKIAATSSVTVERDRAQSSEKNNLQWKKRYETTTWKI